MDATGPWAPATILLSACHPHGPVQEEVFEAYSQDVEAHLSEPVDAVYLSHHGAMVATHLNDPDGELAARVREIPRPLPRRVSAVAPARDGLRGRYGRSDLAGARALAAGKHSPAQLPAGPRSGLETSICRTAAIQLCKRKYGAKVFLFDRGAWLLPASNREPAV
jgi:hypothetical protein